MRFPLVCLALLGCSTDTFAPSDASSDASSDAAMLPDGVTPDGAPCPAPPTCPMNALCTTFDMSGMPFAPFKATMTGPGGVDISTDRFVTCPASLHSIMPMTTSTGSQATIGAIVGVVSGSNVPHASIELDAWLPTAVPSDASYVAVGAGITQSGVGLGANATTWYLFGEAAGRVVPLLVPPLVGAWNHIRIDVTFSTDGGIGGASVAYDTNGMGRRTASFVDSTLTGGSIITSVATEIGIHLSTTAPSQVSAYYDNVVFSPF